MYKIEELDPRNDSEEEQIRTRHIFEDIKARAINGDEISEHEKDFFSLGVKLSLKKDGKLEDYECCDNYRFKTLYLTYFHDLSGQGSYQKVGKGRVYLASLREVLDDINYLSRVAYKWNKIIENERHTNELLRQISQETREELKKISKHKRPLLFRKEKEEYTIRRREILLHSKFIYCTALMILEMFEKDDFILRLNDHEIEINEYSIIHILNRHFAQIVKKDFTKSYHIKDVVPKYFNKTLKDIFIRIEQSGLYKGQSIENINFQYKGKNYAVWTHKRYKQRQGVGNVEYYRLETFYPIENTKVLDLLNNEYEIKNVDAELSVYIKKSGNNMTKRKP